MTVVTRCAWTFPWPNGITTNHMYRPTERLGQRALTGAAVRWRRDVVDLVALSRLRLPAGLLAVDVALHPPDRVKRDVDGPIKLLIDSIFRAYRDDYAARGLPAALADDYRVVDLHVHRYDPSRTSPRIEVRVATWTPADREARST